MSEVIIDVQVLRDEYLDPTGIEYSLTGLKIRSWLGIYVGENRVARLRTNNQGEVSGTLSPVPSEYHDYLISLGGFKHTIRLDEYVNDTGIIAGISDEVEDTDNDGLPNVGYHELTLRYE